MNMTREIKIEEDELYPYFFIVEPQWSSGEEVLIDKTTYDWILKVQKDFAEVQEYLRSIHPDYMER